jgi:hypothetical protein
VANCTQYDCRYCNCSSLWPLPLASLVTDLFFLPLCWLPLVTVFCPTLRHLFFYLYLFLSLCCGSPALCSWMPPLKLHCLLPCLVNVEKLGGKGGELWLLVLVGKGSLLVLLILLRCLASRESQSIWVLLCNGRDEFLSRVIWA